MTRRTALGAWLALSACAGGCNVPEPPRPAGSLPGDASTRSQDAAGDARGGARACGRGIVVVEEPDDYASTNVALVETSGRVLAESLASSATSSVGLVAPLSGDVVTPTMMARGESVVLVDRAPAASRIVWVDVATASTRELAVGQGFYANPHDYAEISETKAYVTRFGGNPTPGKQPFDRGSDVLVVDPSRLLITASIDMTAALGDDAHRALPRPDQLVVVRGTGNGDGDGGSGGAALRAFVLLGALPRDFSVAVPSRLVAVDAGTDAVTDIVTFTGFSNCAGLALSPDEQQIAVLCSGSIDPDAPSALTGSGIVIVDVTGTPRIERALRAEDLGDGPVGFSADYATPGVLLFQTFGYFSPGGGAGRDDAIVRLDLRSGATDVVLRSAGVPFTLGGIACDAACEVCFAADAGRRGGVVHRFDVDGEGALVRDDLVKVETRLGLPPRYLGRF